MKIKLLFTFFIISFISLAQNQINSFYGTNGSIISAVANPNTLNHDTGGVNQNWTFSGFVPLGNTTYTYVAPTTSESSTYPGTTNVIVSTSTSATGKMFTKAAGETISITGLDSAGLNINFNGGTGGSGNATLGTFPMVYPFTNTDNDVSGNYVNGTNSGTFSGTLTTTGELVIVQPEAVE